MVYREKYREREGEIDRPTQRKIDRHRRYGDWSEGNMSEYFKNPVHHVYKAWENSVSWIDLMIPTINLSIQ